MGCMAFIFFLSSQSSLPIPPSVAGLDKLLHGLAYGVLAYLVSHASASFQIISFRRVLLVTALVAAYGVTDEVHQSFVPGRDASLWDIVADGAGAFIVTQLLLWHGRRTTLLS